jgi:CBS domain-containing protein
MEEKKQEQTKVCVDPEMTIKKALDYMGQKRYTDAFVLVEEAIKAITMDYNSQYNQLISLKMRLTHLMADEVE